MTITRYIVILLVITFLSGCATQIDPSLEKQRQLQIQRMQTRVFDVNNSFDKNNSQKITRGVVAAFQDLNFLINNLDVAKGVVEAKKFGDYPIEMTVTIQPVSDDRISVHGIAQYNKKRIDDPFLYEQFFSSLQKFLPIVSNVGN